MGAFHVGNARGIEQFWTTNGSTFSVDELMELNPYLGRTVENSAIQEQIKQEERDKWFREEMERRSAPSYPVDEDKDDVESADET